MAKLASRFTAITLRQVSVPSSAMPLPSGKMPAFSTSMSSPPNALTPSSSAAPTADSSVTSHTIPRKSGRACIREMSWFTSSPTTAAPLLRNASTQARPIPEAAPVTSATSPEKTGAGPARRSFACSRSQYSTSKMSAGDSAFHPPSTVAFRMTSIV